MGRQAAPGQRQAVTASRHRTPAPAGRRGTGRRQGRPHGWHRSGRGGTRQPAPSRWRWPSGTAQVRPAPGTGLQRQTGPHRSGPVSPQHPSRWRGSSGRARAGGPHQVKGKPPKRKAPGTGHRAPGTRHQAPAPAGRHGTGYGHGQAGPHRWHRSGRVAQSTQHPAAGAGAGHQAPHTTQRLASHTQRVSSAADKGAKGGHFSRPFPGPCVRVRWRGIKYRTRANSKAAGGTVQARGQPHRHHRPKTSKPWAGRCSLEQNTKTGHQRQRFRRVKQKPAKARGEGKRKKGPNICE